MELDAGPVIVGGGIGGLATALALQRRGMASRVVESGPHLSEVDTGITLWSFAVARLYDLGLGSQLDDIGAPTERVVSRGEDGRLLNQVTLRSRRRGEAPSYDVHRAELQAALAAGLPTDAITFGARCVAVTQSLEHACARLEGGEELCGHLVVGADGVRSATRAHVAGPTTPTNAGFGVWRGLLTDPDERLVPAGVHLRVYGRSGVFGAARLSRGRIRWYAGSRIGGPSRAADDSSRTDELRALFGSWAAPVRDIIDASVGGPVLFHNTPRISPLPKWSRGRVVLIGDAAHGAAPTLGISGGLAIVDGVELGEALYREADVITAISSFEASRRRIGVRIQREATLVGWFVGAHGRWTAPVRNRLLARPFAPFQRVLLAQFENGGALRRPPGTRPAVPPVHSRTTADRKPPSGIESTAEGACLDSLRRAVGSSAHPMERHALRVNAIAHRLADLRTWQVDRELLTCAALLHDIGLYDDWSTGAAYVDDSKRAVEQLLRSFGWPPERIQRAADAAQRHHAVRDQRTFSLELEVLRLADQVDLSGGRVGHGLDRAFLGALFTALPRDGLYRHIGTVLGARLLRHPMGAFGIVAPRPRS